ncbi:MAG: Ig-like domain-containing protein [Gammaproteobacteria bacterium]
MTARSNSLVHGLLLLILAIPATAAPPARTFGRDRPFATAELPLSQLRAQLERLPAVKRQRAMKWLHRFNFPVTDVPNLRTDAEGGVLFVDPPPATVEPAPAAGTAGTPTVAAAIPTASAFLLHSRPGAANVVYLDFDGQAVSNTAWNGTGGTLNAVAYDVDGVAGFSTAELNNIINIWRRVSEDFASFNVDVTTQLPAAFGARTARVLITRDSDASGRAMPWQGAGGVAYIDVFGRSDYAKYQPAFVYYNRLGGGREDYVAEAASHEMGHNLGLTHDGTSGASYYGGHGAGATSWAPIMGIGYNRAVTQWSRGEYAGANNTQDDMAIIAGKLAVRADDHANAAVGATPLISDASGNVTSATLDADWTNAQPQNRGVLGTAGDVDVFVFSAAAGPLTLTARPHVMPVNTAGGNVDLQLQLFSEGGALLGTASPNGATVATLSTTVPAGRMFLHVSGVGDPAVPYSDYASVGQFYLSGKLPVSVANTVPPSPSPMAFEIAPVVLDTARVSMRATTAIDDTGSAVEYRFECVLGGAGCVTSAWQTARDYVAGGLAPVTQYRFRVRARDAAGNETAPSAEFAVTTPAAPNRPPVAVADSATVKRQRSVVIRVLANDSDPDRDALRISAVTQGARGRATVFGGSVFYTSNSTTGDDTFTYTVNDGRGGSASATVSVTITP